MHNGRRAFLKRVSAVTALGVVGAQWTPIRWLAAQPAEAFLHSPEYDEAALRALALHALDAARAAGAPFADVRLNVARSLAFGCSSGRVGGTALGMSAAIGVRAAVDGTWGFAGGSILDRDAAARVGRRAVARAKAGRPRHPRRTELAPAPVVPDGRWQTPIETDPFTIPVGDIEAVYLDAMAGAMQVKGLRDVSAQPSWSKSDRVFACTEGSMIVQRTYTASPAGAALAFPPGDHSFWIVEGTQTTRTGGYGYESLSKANLRDDWRRAAETVVRLAALPHRSVDVGRIDVVLSPSVMAGIIAETVGRALALDRALGDQANGAGTTYAMPPLDIVGRYQLGSPLVTIVGDRSRPAANATVGWDEEGVKPDDFTLVKDGVVVDYVTTRDTAPTLTEWYARQGGPMHSHGCAARTGLMQPILQLPNLTLRPGPSSGSVDDLVSGIKRGVYIDTGWAATDQQLFNTQVRGGMAYEIVNGRRVGLLKDVGLQFSTQQFWKGVDALGGPETARLEHVQVDSPGPDALHLVGIHCVPARVRSLNVINLGASA